MELDLLKKIVSEVMKVDPNELKNDTTFIDDLGADSLDVFRIIMNMEEQFQIVIPRDVIYDIQTLDDAYSLIKNNKRHNM